MKGFLKGIELGGNYFFFKEICLRIIKVITALKPGCLIMLNYGLRQHNFQPLPWVAHTGAERTWRSWGRALHGHLGSLAALAGTGVGG